MAVEHKFERSAASTPGAPSLKIRGKIDCVIRVPRVGLVIIDYKYSRGTRIKEHINPTNAAIEYKRASTYGPPHRSSANHLPACSTAACAAK